MHAQTASLQLYHPTLPLLPSRFLTRSISCTRLIPLLPLCVPLRLLSPLPSSVKICMQRDEIAQAYTCATHPPSIRLRIVRSHCSRAQTAFERTQTSFPINNKCSVPHCSGETERAKSLSDRSRNPEEGVWHR